MMRRGQDALGVLSYTHAGPGIADMTLTGKMIPAGTMMIVER
jgi:hypothetical protein